MLRNSLFLSVLRLFIAFADSPPPTAARRAPRLPQTHPRHTRSRAAGGVPPAQTRAQSPRKPARKRLKTRMFVGNYKAKRAKSKQLHTVRWEVPQRFTEYQVLVSLRLKLNQTHQPRKPLQLRQGWQTRAFAAAEKFPRAKNFLRVRSARPRRALAPPSPSRPRALAVSPSSPRRLAIEPSLRHRPAIASDSAILLHRHAIASRSTSVILLFAHFRPFSPVISRFCPLNNVKTLLRLNLSNC